MICRAVFVARRRPSTRHQPLDYHEATLPHIRRKARFVKSLGWLHLEDQTRLEDQAAVSRTNGRVGRLQPEPVAVLLNGCG